LYDGGIAGTIRDSSEDLDSVEERIRRYADYTDKALVGREGWAVRIAVTPKIESA
jgi:hypothetical protein